MHARIEKLISHNIKHCAYSDCNKGLANYKTSRFCAMHEAQGMADMCGIIPCGQPVEPGQMTCSLPAHKQWYKAYCARFARTSFPGVQRVMRRQQLRSEERAAGDNVAEVNSTPNLIVRLPPLGETPGDAVIHTFRARWVYCLLTIQWACGTPIGWSKCYKSESLPQAFSLLQRIWSLYEDLLPSYLAYDRGCDLLRHIATPAPEQHLA